jgi:hypothetical protein
MGWGFRKSINWGPMRLKLSKSGVGYSVGTGGFRIGRDARGRQYRAISVPHTGIYRRDYFPRAQGSASPPPFAANSPVSQPTVKTGQNASAGIRWILYVTTGVLLYALIRAVF